MQPEETPDTNSRLAWAPPILEYLGSHRDVEVSTNFPPDDGVIGAGS